MSGVLAYTVQANKDAPIYLCVMDDANKQFHRFEITPLTASRLTSDCAVIVNRHLGGYNNPTLK